jgi:formylglycine-generating enzyme required for sulfatase activity
MDPSSPLLTQIGRTVLEAAPDEVLSGLALGRLPEIARQILDEWQPGHSADQQRAEIQSLAQTTTADARPLTTALASELGKSRSAEMRETLASYLRQVPAVVRRALRRPEDPTGLTVPAELTLAGVEDLLLLLPVRRPHFEPGAVPFEDAPWQLEELLGVDALGEVWKAREPHLPNGEAVALKFCLDPASANVLRHEAKLLDRIVREARHPGIVPLRQTFLASDPPCLAYEFRTGGDLTSALNEWIRTGQGPSPSQIARVIMRLASIVAFVHRLEPPVVHRDLKPASFLVNRLPDGKLSMRLLDLGAGSVALSNAIRQGLRGSQQTQQLIAGLRGSFTKLYASAQLLRGADAEPRDDVFALGVIWYQLLSATLTSGPPNHGRWPQQLAERGMSTPLIDLLIACLEENPDNRPRHAGDLSERLAALFQAAKSPAPELVATVAQPGQPLPRRVVNQLQMTLLLIPAGAFRMGSPATEVERGNDEGPQREVTLSQPFYMSINPVTQRQFESVMGYNPSYFNAGKGGGPDFPVERISWEEAGSFCRRVSELPEERAAGRSYRLPTEAEWEFACRAGQTAAFTFGPGLSSRDANFNGNYPYGGAERGPYLERTTRVGSYSPNAFGLYDMHGNVWEWCADYYDRTYLRHGPAVDPPGPTSGIQRVVRGGSCYNIGRFCRSAYRFGVAPTNRALDIGLRVVMTMKS